MNRHPIVPWLIVASALSALGACNSEPPRDPRYPEERGSSLETATYAALLRSAGPPPAGALERLQDVFPADEAEWNEGDMLLATTLGDIAIDEDAPELAEWFHEGAARYLSRRDPEASELPGHVAHVSHQLDLLRARRGARDEDVSMAQLDRWVRAAAILDAIGPAEGLDEYEPTGELPESAAELVAHDETARYRHDRGLRSTNAHWARAEARLAEGDLEGAEADFNEATAHATPFHSIGLLHARHALSLGLAGRENEAELAARAAIDEGAPTSNEESRAYPELVTSALTLREMSQLVLLEIFEASEQRYPSDTPAGARVRLAALEGGEPGPLARWAADPSTDLDALALAQLPYLGAPWRVEAASRLGIAAEDVSSRELAWLAVFDRIRQLTEQLTIGRTIASTDELATLLELAVTDLASTATQQERVTPGSVRDQIDGALFVLSRHAAVSPNLLHRIELWKGSL